VSESKQALLFFKKKKQKNFAPRDHGYDANSGQSPSVIAKEAKQSIFLSLTATYIRHGTQDGLLGLAHNDEEMSA
jgi:hypothetical protein